MSAARPRRFAIVRARFNEPITEALLEGALHGFADAGIERKLVDVHEVPGSFELPVAALWLARSKRYAAIVCLGCVIRGETPHFEHVASAATRGIADAALATGVPVMFGVLTTDTVEQAWARAKPTSSRSDHVRAGSGSNKGYDAARGAVEMAQLSARLKRT